MQRTSDQFEIIIIIRSIAGNIAMLKSEYPGNTPECFILLTTPIHNFISDELFSHSCSRVNSFSHNYTALQF